MKYLIISILMTCSFTLLGAVTACSPDSTEPPTETPAIPDNNGDNDSGNNNNNGGNSGNPDEPGNTNNMKIEIKTGENIFTATLQDNATATAFSNMLPLTITMNELNNNEKYHNFAGSLPTAATRPGTIRNGDLMLYGNNCLVLFYKTFTSSYSYTPIGAIDNPSGLEAALGTGSITITFGQTTNQ